MAWRWHPDCFDLRYDEDGVLDPIEFYLLMNFDGLPDSYIMLSLFVYDVKTLSDDLFEKEDVLGRLEEKKPDSFGL